MNVEPGSQSREFIDRDSAIPAYQQIISDLRNKIVSNEWEIGDRLPSEHALSSYYQVSRVTLRQALNSLESDGIIRRQQGHGSFVTSNPNQVIVDLRFPSIYSESRAMEKPSLDQAVPTVLSLDEQDSTDKFVAAKLQVSVDSPTVCLRRLFSHGETAIGISTAWFPKSLVPNLIEKGLVDSSISKTLTRRFNYEVTSVENEILVVKLQLENSRLLNLPYASPCLRIDSTSLVAGGIPLYFSTTLWSGEMTRFHYEVHK